MISHTLNLPFLTQDDLETRRDRHYPVHREQSLGSLEVLVVLVGQQLVDLFLPIVLIQRAAVSDRRRVAVPLLVTCYYLVILQFRLQFAFPIFFCGDSQAAL